MQFAFTFYSVSSNPCRDTYFEHLDTKALFPVSICLQLVYVGQTSFLFQDYGPLCFIIFHKNL
jgi:hypothetical protein